MNTSAKKCYQYRKKSKETKRDQTSIKVSMLTVCHDYIFMTTCGNGTMICRGASKMNNITIYKYRNRHKKRENNKKRLLTSL